MLDHLFLIDQPGSYVLTRDITGEAPLIRIYGQAPGLTVHLDLNGHTLTATAAAIRFQLML